MDEKKENKKSNLPFIIIGLVLLVAIIGGYALMQNGQKTTSNTAKNTTSTTTTSSKPGANPAWTKGPQTAPVTIEEFADFQCPTCGAQHPKLNEIRAKYGDKVKIVFRQFPLATVHPNAYDAACAAEAAGIQGKFWEMQHQLFTNQSSWSNAPDPKKVFAEYAQKIGLNVDQFTTDMGGLVARNRIDADIQRGRSLSIQSTPSIFINGKLLGSVPEMEVGAMSQVIDAELAKAQPAQQSQAAPANSATANSNK